MHLIIYHNRRSFSGDRDERDSFLTEERDLLEKDKAPTYDPTKLFERFQAVGRIEVNQPTIASKSKIDLAEHAYAMSQTVHCNWWEQPGIEKLGNAPGYRSTSIGDIVAIASLTEKGLQHNYWVVACLGFLKVELPNIWKGGIETRLIPPTEDEPDTYKGEVVINGATRYSLIDDCPYAALRRAGETAANLAGYRIPRTRQPLSA